MSYLSPNNSMCSYPSYQEGQMSGSDSFTHGSMSGPETASSYSSYTGTGEVTSSGGSGIMSPPIGSDLQTAEPSVGTEAAAYQNDPVTKAVVDNIMGTLPTKKPKVSLHCDICNLEISSQVVLDAHLTGAKHAKKVKSQQILKELHDTGKGFSKDQKTNILSCDICNVVVNSSQQLQTHLAGNKHKHKMLKRPADSTPALEETTKQQRLSISDDNGVVENIGNHVVPSQNKVGEVQEASPLTGEAGIKKVEGKGGKSSNYFCEACQVTLNSDVQLKQHTGSKKHKDRVSGVPKQCSLKKPWKEKRWPRMGKSQSFQPLSNSFVCGGKQFPFTE